MKMDTTFPTKLPSMRGANYTFILWGENFEEMAAVVFAAELRRVGVNVKLVGLTGLQAVGAHGLVLATDLTLAQALPLADKAICVMVPCSALTLQRSENDPRVPQFFQAALANHAHFIISHASLLQQSSLGTMATPLTKFTAYTDSSNLIDLASATATFLAAQAESNNGREHH